MHNYYLLHNETNTMAIKFIIVLLKGNSTLKKMLA